MPNDFLEIFKNLNIVKSYRNFIKNYGPNNIIKFIEEYYRKKKNSMIEKVSLKFFLDNNNNYGYDILFSFLQSNEYLTLYNFQRINNDNIIYNYNNKILDKDSILLDENYLYFLEKNNIKQKIKLICIINNEYIKYINNMTYPYIYQLHFEFGKNNINEMIKINFNDIFKIIITYIINIKYLENV